MTLSSPTFSGQPVAEAGFETSARQKSIVTFSRTGEIQFLDDFEDGGNKWAITVGGTGASAVISVAQARNGEKSTLLTGGSTSPFSSDLLHRSPLLTLSRIGLEVSFLLDSVIDTFTMQAILRDGTNQIQVAIRYDETAQRQQFLNGSGVFEDLQTINMENLDTLFHTCKFVFDSQKVEYVRAVFDNISFDLNGVPAFQQVSAIGPNIQVQLGLVGRTGQNDTVFVDDFILTHNEP